MTQTMGVMGGRWKFIIVANLSRGATRFGQLAYRMPQVSRKVLTEQLKELEEDGVVLREAFGEVPPRVEYSLTAYGQALLPILDQLLAWHCEGPNSEHLRRLKGSTAASC